MHEFFLTGSAGETVFDLPLQADRMKFLQVRFAKGFPSVNSDMEFVVPPKLEDIFSNYHLRVIPTYSGCKLAVKCRKQQLADGTIVYRPMVSIPSDLELFIQLAPKIPLADFTHISSTHPAHPKFIFSNDPFTGTKAFPFLSAPVPPFDAARQYDQGDIALHGPNDVRVFLNNGAVNPWQPLPGVNYISEADRLLVPLQMTWSFLATDNVTDTSFVLTDQLGNQVKEINIISGSVIQTARLDFHTENNLIKTVPGHPLGTDLVYTLTVNSSNGYSRKVKLIFADDRLNLSSAAGLIHMKIKLANPSFDLLDNDGLLFTRISPGGILTPAPIFELWWKSRLLFWYYRSNEQKKLKLMTDTQDLLDDRNGLLVTKRPYARTQQPLMLKKPDNSLQYLPNPLPADAVRWNGSEYFLDVMVPASKLFPLA